MAAPKRRDESAAQDEVRRNHAELKTQLAQIDQKLDEISKKVGITTLEPGATA